MSSSLLALARAIGDLLAGRDCAVDDVVAALGVLRSVVFGDRQESSKIGDIAQLADLCKQRGQGENVLHEPELSCCLILILGREMLTSLLQEVAPDWIACLTESERSSLFDDFFLAGRPSEVLMALVPALGTEHSLESEFDNVLCIQAERLLIKCFVENPGVRNIAEEFAEAGQPSLQCITQVAQLVSSVPDRVRPKAPASLHSPSFLSSVVSQILSAAKEGWDGSTDSLAKGKFLFIGELFNKLCRRGHADVVAAKFVSELSHFVQTLKTVPKEITCWQGVVLSMKDFYALERMAEAVLYRLNDCYVTEQDAYFTLHSLFGDPLSHASVRFLLWKVFPLRILNCILSFSVLCKHGEEKNIQKDIARSLAESWAEKNYIQSASNDRQAYVTAALGISIKAMTKEEISGTDSLLKFILDGVSRRLDSPFPPIRRMAKQIALVYSIVINPDNPLLLDDEDNIEDLQNWDVPDYSGKKALADAPEAGNDGIARQVKAKTTVEVDDPDAVVDLANLGGNEESDSESEASLKPYDMSDDEADLDKAKFPSQLSSCAASLRKGDDPDALIYNLQIERALDVCENFVRLMPDELENSAADLVQALVYVRCSAADDTVEVRRHRALVALLVCAPLTSADAAQELANGAEPKEVTRAAGPWKEVSRPLSGGSLLSWGPTYERELPPRPGQEELGKSRRWGKRSLELQVERLKTGGGESCSYKRNRFAPVATAFMLPIMRDYDKKRSGLDIMGTDFIILARLIMMLGVCMQCLSLQPDAPALGAGLIEVLRSRPIFKHPEPYVRRAVLFAASRVLVALSPSHVAALDASLTEGLEWIREWSLEVASHDPDPDCAKVTYSDTVIVSSKGFYLNPYQRVTVPGFQPRLGDERLLARPDYREFAARSSEVWYFHPNPVKDSGANQKAIAYYSRRGGSPHQLGTFKGHVLNSPHWINLSGTPQRTMLVYSRFNHEATTGPSMVLIELKVNHPDVFLPAGPDSVARSSEELGEVIGVSGHSLHNNHVKDNGFRFRQSLQQHNEEEETSFSLSMLPITLSPHQQQQHCDAGMNFVPATLAFHHQAQAHHHHHHQAQVQAQAQEQQTAASSVFPFWIDNSSSNNSSSNSPSSCSETTDSWSCFSDGIFSPTGTGGSVFKSWCFLDSSILDTKIDAASWQQQSSKSLAHFYDDEPTDSDPISAVLDQM
ncbi:hypothetical protein SELMODRAFT_445763 [Selaginella moellendorffii]|uniref:Uncharacterized protein n=1 Tax=Selaginella moellendorffii TaxID=88036 RepID=D8SL41_SELML|nr:hypothetical protein SELMODRAFT_445763 [Selaginella moellendorffii]